MDKNRKKVWEALVLQISELFPDVGLKEIAKHVQNADGNMELAISMLLGDVSSNQQPSKTSNNVNKNEDTFNKNISDSMSSARTKISEKTWNENNNDNNNNNKNEISYNVINKNKTDNQKPLDSEKESSKTSNPNPSNAKPFLSDLPIKTSVIA